MIRVSGTSVIFGHSAVFAIGLTLAACKPVANSSNLSGNTQTTAVADAFWGHLASIQSADATSEISLEKLAKMPMDRYYAASAKGLSKSGFDFEGATFRADRNSAALLSPDPSAPKPYKTLGDLLAASGIRSSKDFSQDKIRKGIRMAIDYHNSQTAAGGANGLQLGVAGCAGGAVGSGLALGAVGVECGILSFFTAGIAAVPCALAVAALGAEGMHTFESCKELAKDRKEAKNNGKGSGKNNPKGTDSKESDSASDSSSDKKDDRPNMISGAL